MDIPAQLQIAPVAPASADNRLPSTHAEDLISAESGHDQRSGPLRFMTDSQVLGEEEVEAMVTSENERTGIMEVDEDDDEEEDEGEGEAHENDEEEEAEVSAHVGSGYVEHFLQ